MTSSNWQITGEWIDSCNCAVGCPCNFDQIPTQGYCAGFICYYIGKGNYGDVSLNGLHALIVGKWGHGLLTNGDFVLGFVFDSKANAGQREALKKVFCGEAGGMFGEWARLTAKKVGIEYLPFEFRHEGEAYGVKAGSTIAVDSKAYSSGGTGWGAPAPKGELMTLLNASSGEGGPGLPIVMGIANDSKIKVFHWDFDFTGLNSKWGPVKLSGP